MHSKSKKRLIITLQLKNAEVYPGSNLHGTVILQLMQKHHHVNNNGNDSIDLKSKNKNETIIIDRISISVSGICNINLESEQTHFPIHLQNENDNFNILCGKENILGRGLQLELNKNKYENNNIQFDFVVQLPPVLPCSYCGYFIQYLYFTQLIVNISKNNIKPTKCRVPFYVLPNNNLIIKTPKDLQERMSIFRKRKNEIKNNLFNNINNIIKEEEQEEHKELKQHTILTKEEKDKCKYRITLENKCIGILLLNDTIFYDGQCIEGYLSLYIPCIVRITLIHIEKCGNKQKHQTTCCTNYQCCWYTPSFTFTLKIPNNAFKSFKSDLCQSNWIINFKFAISQQLLIENNTNNTTNNNNSQLGYLNASYDIWKLHKNKNKKKNKKNKNKNKFKKNYEIDKILKWELPITVTTAHNPLRCVTRSNAVVVKIT